MSPGLVALAIALVAAGVLAVSTRDPRAAIVALGVMAVGSPILTQPLGDALPLAARLVAAMLAAYLLWAALRGVDRTGGSPIGWPAESLVAAAAGVAAASLLPPGRTAVEGQPAALVAGVALLAVAGAPLLVGRDALRLTLGALVAVHGAWLVRAGLGGTPPASEELAMAALIAGLGGAGAALVARARSGSGGLELGARRTPFDPSARRGPPVPRTDPGPGRETEGPGPRRPAERGAP